MGYALMCDLYLFMFPDCPDENDALCMYVSDVEVTWFDARADCITREGDRTALQVSVIIIILIYNICIAPYNTIL